MISDATRGELNRIEVLIAREEYEQALELVKALERVKPVPLGVINAKAKVLKAMKRLAEAEACYAGVCQLYSIGHEELEALDIRKKVANARRHAVVAERLRFDHAFCKSKIDPDEECMTHLERRLAALERAERFVLGNRKDPDGLIKLGWAYFQMRQLPAAAVCFAAGMKLHGLSSVGNSGPVPVLRGEPNLLDLYEALFLGKSRVSVVYWPDPDDTARCEMISRILADAGQLVYLVRPPVDCGVVGQDYDERKVVDDCFAMLQEVDGVRVLQPYTAFPGEQPRNGLTGVMDRLYEELGDRYAVLYSSRRGILDLMETPSLRHRVKLLSAPFGDDALFDAFSAFGYFGDYAEYIGRIYEISVLKHIEQTPTTALSVIIPTRNSAAPLQYTLRTCLEQPVSDLEILICDNSTPGNHETKALVEELSDSRIRYIRSPRPLNLTRNFEYAFLQARGDFLLSMGSDDGITANGLPLLMEVLDALPECDVIQWDRIFYVWPDALSDRSGLFQTVRPYKRGDVNVNFYNAASRMRDILKNPNHVGLLPMLYINSGMRRRYLRKLLDRTGQLWDGMSQDVYIGLVNCALNPTIPLVEFPITIAGMGGNSIGMKASQGWKTGKDVKVQVQEYSQDAMGYVVPSRLEHRVANGHPDSTNLYQSFLRVVQSGCNPSFTAELVDWKWAFVFMMHQNPKDSLHHDRYIKMMQYAADQHSDSFGKWFRKEVVPHAYSPPPERPKTKAGKSYTEGMLEDGGLIMNSEKMGVTNVYEACQLFEKLLDAASNKGGPTELNMVRWSLTGPRRRGPASGR